MHRETINEHIRNGLSPIKLVIDLLSKMNKEGFNEQTYEYILSQLDICNVSIKRLCMLGITAYEDSEDYWRNTLEQIND